MISVVVYGRNDNHGYNLHKRAAISLNCVAEVLSEETDEILFVDYNTPDDLPTFPEAIRDTLSPRSRARLRVIRVRPAIHRRHFAHRTHLQVLEPIARNIALRRSDPRNRWVLSTNADMIFVPNPDEASLSRIVAGLSDGFYHLPRFELPEALWESFDRARGAETIAALRSLSGRYHLDEIVFGDRRILYDGPGDFQLCLRRDLFAIDGFDEDMLLGWHVDSNLAVRLALHDRPVQSALDHLRGYHCDHTRQPTVLHAGGAPQNDPRRFVDAVAQPFLPEQRQRWGLPEETFEEIRLGAGDSFGRYRAALDRAIAAPQAGAYAAHYTAAAWGRVAYDPDHVLPYIADLFANLPPAATVALWLCSGALLERLDRAMPVLLPAGRFAVPSDAPCLRADAAALRSVFVASAAECLAADVLVFEFSAGDGSEDQVHDALRTALRHEGARLERLGGDPRRFIVINAVNSAVEATVEANLDVALAPFSSRIRYGWLRAAPARRDTGSRRWLQVAIQDQMARLLPPPSSELTTTEAILALAQEMPAAERAELLADHRAPLAAYSVRANAPLTFADRPETAAGVPIADRRLPLPAGGGLFDMWDWEDAAWFEFARRHCGGDAAADWFARSEAVWEPVSLLHLLQGHGLLRPEASLLVCGRGAGEFAAGLAQYAMVTVARFDDAGGELLHDPEPAVFAPRPGIPPGRLRPWSAAPDGPFDGVVLPRHALFAGEGRSASAWASAVLARLAPLLRPRGKIVFSLTVAAGGEHPAAHMSLATARQAESLRAGAAVYSLLRPRRLTVSTASLERERDWVVDGRSIRRTVTRSGGATLVEAVLALEHSAGSDRDTAG